MIEKMNKLIISSLLILLTLNSIRTEEELTILELRINKTEYLVGEQISVDVMISNLPDNRNVTVTVEGKSNKNITDLLDCIDCSTRLFSDKQLVHLTDRLESGDRPVNKKINDTDKKINNQFTQLSRHVNSLQSSDHQLIKRETKNNVYILTFRWQAIEASKLTLYIETNLERNETDRTKKIFVEIGIIKSRNWSILSDIVGWSYFAFWMICFYPQAYMNWKRKSCVGLSLDYCILNFVGFLFYSIYNFAIYFVDVVQAEYERTYPYSNIPVLTNDIVFSLHHMVISAIIAIQCIFIYENGNQTFSRSCIISLTTVYSGFLILGYYVMEGKFNLLDYIYYSGYIKMYFTALKYVPQAYSNYKKKSTKGWSLIFNICDFLGGSSCLIQMFILIHNYQDWSFITKNVAKTGIALLTLVFDVLFLSQHFLYANKTQQNKNKLIGYGATQVSCSKEDDNCIVFKKKMVV